MKIRKGWTIPHFGPAIPIIPEKDFTKFGLTPDQIEQAWTLIGPSVIRNMRVTSIRDTWKLFTLAYLEGLHHGSSIEREKHVEPTDIHPEET